MSVLSYPFDPAALLQNKKKLKKQLLSLQVSRIQKRIAVLGGSTTSEIVNMLELFLLDYGIEPVFYQSEYNRYWQDAVFSTPELDEFHPDLIFIHTTNRNLELPFDMSLTKEDANNRVKAEFHRYQTMWEQLFKRFSCSIIQNNFELPTNRVLGNREFSDFHGFVWSVNQMNTLFSQYAGETKNFYIHDINWLSAQFGLDKWGDPLHWYMYKYALSMEAIPIFAHSLASIIKSIYGGNKKALVLDLDNTLWGGIVGDDGVNGLEIGQETPTGQAYFEFQSYLKKLKSIGVTLTVASKNENENAIAGLNHPDGVLKPDDFAVIKANWNPKSNSIEEICSTLNILPDSVVFLDDNPAEREIVKGMLPVVSVPPMDDVEQYLKTLDRAYYFETTSLSEDDLKRNEMYRANTAREDAMQKFESYEDYLASLEMKAQIKPFTPLYYERITQLTNKSNQFNVTTKRYSPAEIQQVAESDSHLTFYGRLTDKFGDNGIVSVVIGEKNGDILEIQLWLMSCRVLKRGMEYAMLNTVVQRSKAMGIKTLRGYYYKTAKNNMVRELFGDFGFQKIRLEENGDSVWELDISDYEQKPVAIMIEGE